MGSTSTQTQTFATATGDRVVAAASELQPITAQNVQKLFPGSVSYLAKQKEEAYRNVEKELEGQGHQQKQVKAMEEVCILLDKEDAPIGGANKYICMINVVLLFRWHLFHDANIVLTRPSNGQCQTRPSPPRLLCLSL